ncbi:MAG: 1-acyl-sn-glycerol-3-phosphate acyltransferase [Ekhidna sp.]|nr:1-acyl-sn-glycerol-3-phosphate acyltransferase [Ekhidna sp.]MBC6410883.1 1-acyl-sn-glycerol-3-phosphate acyltransferase [Ekhidna sp.]MBC6427453.1 1-acyl-sn-glycerol-3-phosphate acyltransferase [Ekhidna sp.]
MEKSVDIRKLIKSKNPKLLKRLPGFVIRWVEKVIHQDEVNTLFEQHQNSDEYVFCKDALNLFKLRFTIKGKENILPYPKKIIFASNHPLGGMDAISIIHLLKGERPDIKFIVNDLLMAINQLKNRFIGVNKVGKSTVLSLQKVEEQFANGTATFIFPAGLVSRKIKGKIIDLEWKKTFITKAKKYGIPIMPVHIGGRLTDRFYRLASFRKFLGIKVNFEMFFLVDELFRQKNMKIDIIIGKPIAPEVLDRSRNDKEWANWVKEQVYNLPSNLKA